MRANFRHAFSVPVCLTADESAPIAVPHSGISFGTNDLQPARLRPLQFTSDRDTLHPCQLSFEKSR